MFIEKKIINKIVQKARTSCNGCCGSSGIFPPSPLPSPEPSPTPNPTPTPTPTPVPSIVSDTCTNIQKPCDSSQNNCKVFDYTCKIIYSDGSTKDYTYSEQCTYTSNDCSQPFCNNYDYTCVRTNPDGTSSNVKYTETCTYKQYMYNNQGNCYFYVYSCNRDYGTSNYTYTYQTDYDCYQPVEYCRVQFSDNVMNDVIQNTPVLTSAIFNADNYSDFISKGEYEDVSKLLVNSIKNKVDSIVIDKGVRLQVYSYKNYSGDLLIDVVGPMIINNAIYENNVLQQINYFDKTFQDVYTHNLFPPSTRKINDPSFLLNNIVNGSMKISCNNKDTDNKNIGVKGRITIPQDNCKVHFANTLIRDNQQTGVFSKAFVSDNYSDIISIGEYSDNAKVFINANKSDSVDGIAVDSGVRLQIYKNKDFTGGVILDVVGPILINNFIHKDTLLKKENYFNKTFSNDLQTKFPPSKRTISSFDLRTINLGSSKISCFNDPNDSLNVGVSFTRKKI